MLSNKDLIEANMKISSMSVKEKDLINQIMELTHIIVETESIIEMSK